MDTTNTATQNDAAQDDPFLASLLREVAQYDRIYAESRRVRLAPLPPVTQRRAAPAYRCCAVCQDSGSHE